jgi:haloalkane dehalogenase
VLTTFGADDNVMAGIEKVFQTFMSGAAGQDHVVLPAAGHFLQEDVGPELAARILAFINKTG